MLGSAKRSAREGQRAVLGGETDAYWGRETRTPNLGLEPLRWEQMASKKSNPCLPLLLVYSRLEAGEQGCFSSGQNLCQMGLE